MAGAAAADLSVQEAALNPDGNAYEINPDAGGHLWISDYGAGQIWQVEASGTYTIYPVSGAPSDARHDASGDVWFADGETNKLGRLSPDALETTMWNIPGAESLYGTGFDGAGRVWVTDGTLPNLYRFTPASDELCTYAFASDSLGAYLAIDDQGIWLGDLGNSRLLNLDPDSGHYTTWQLPSEAYPWALALDPQGNLWWPDPNLRDLARFEPEFERLTRYRLPSGRLPQMIAVTGNLIHFTEVGQRGYGILNPAAATGASSVLNSEEGTVSPSCGVLKKSVTDTVNPTTGTITWAQTSYPLVYDSGGLAIYRLPAGAFPWGITATGLEAWIVDGGRQVLARIGLSSSVTACKLADEDGNPETTADQAPVEDWTLYLEVDGVRQEPGLLTGPDGCATWDNLAPGHSYGVEEEPAGWIPLGPTMHDFGLLPGGASRSHTFVNFEAITVTACKYEDLAGNGLTPDDPLYAQGWGVSLTADGQVVDTQTTGPGGCYTWDGLGPLEEGAYGIREAEVAGWQATEPAEVQFAPPTSGDTFQADLANFQQASLTACVLADEDGDLGTPGDQEPQASWTVYLRVDGQNQLPGQHTGTEGCATWTGLGPGHAYGAAQALPEGWAALAGTGQDLDPVRSGDAETITFVNTTQENYTVFLPLVVRNWH